MPARTSSVACPVSLLTRVGVFDTELGWVAAAWQGESLQALTFGHRSPASAVRDLKLPPPAPLPVRLGPRDLLAARLRAYAAGQPDDFRDVAITLDGYTPFQIRVLEECRRIGYGATATYAELALRVGAPRAARAVGNTLARNRLPLVIPCHRVVGAGGALGGFSAPEGIRMKQRLLTLEKS